MMPTRRSFIRRSLPCLLAPGWALADDAVVRVEGQNFERQVQVAGSTLVLNGTGVRAVAWFKGFAAGLYLTARASTAAQAVATAGPKRLRLCMLYDVPAAEFAKALRKGMQRNAAAADQAALASRIDAFEALIRGIGEVHQGDVIHLDWDPARGLLFSVNGTLQGEPIAGADFFATLLLSFVGEKPFDKKLRAGLLGG